VRKLRQIQVAAPIIAVDPNSPATASPRFGGVASGVGVGVSVGNGVAEGSALRRGVAVAVGDGAGANVSVGTGVGAAVGVGVGAGVGDRQKGCGKHGVGLGDGVGDGVLVWNGPAAAAAGQSNIAAAKHRRPTSRPLSRNEGLPSMRLHLNDEMRLRRTHSAQVVDLFQNNLGKMTVVRKLAIGEDVRLPPARVRLLYSVHAADRLEDVLGVPGLDRYEDVGRSCHAFTSAGLECTRSR
jgi:hypothetical protein